MKHLLKSLTNPKQIFRFKKSKSDVVSKSDPPSFTSSASFFSSSSSSDNSSSSARAAAPPQRAATLPSRTRSSSSSTSSDSDSAADNLAQTFKITRVELETILRRVGGKAPSDEEVSEMIKEIDQDGDGCISLDELETVGSAAGAGEDELREAFEFFDADHDGKITAEELQTAFVAFGDERCTLEDCMRMIEGVDENRDGFVCFQDFARMMDLQQRC